MKLKKRTKNKSFYLSIYNRIKEGKNPSTISKELNLPIQNLQYYLNKLKKEGIIQKKGYGVWEVKKELKISSIGVKTPITDLHAFNIKFPIVSGEIKGSDWEIRNKLRNWLPKYKKLDIFKGMTIRNNNNKSISVFLYPRTIELHKDPYIIEKLAFKIKSYLFEYFKTKHNVILDVMEAETKNIHLETQDNKLKGILKKGELFEVDLGKKAQKIFPKDDIDGKAWFDNSPHPNMIGTTDLEYKRALIFMPFYTQEIMKATNYIAQNYASHVKMVEKGSKTFEKLDKVLEKLNKRLSQTKLTEFI